MAAKLLGSQTSLGLCWLSLFRGLSRVTSQSASASPQEPNQDMDSKQGRGVARDWTKESKRAWQGVEGQAWLL